jgi:hypothetical protein
MTRAETAALIATLKAAYTRMEIPDLDGMIALWTKMLGDLDAGALVLAVEKHIASSPFPPTIADLRKLVVTAVLPAPAEVAWSEIQRALERANRSIVPTWSSELVARVVDDLGGWSRLCDIPTDQLHFERQAFIRHYSTIREHARDVAQAPRLGAPAKVGELVAGIIGGKVLALSAPKTEPKP